MISGTKSTTLLARVASCLERGRKEKIKMPVRIKLYICIYNKSKFKSAKVRHSKILFNLPYSKFEPFGLAGIKWEWLQYYKNLLFLCYFSFNLGKDIKEIYWFKWTIIHLWLVPNISMLSNMKNIGLQCSQPILL